MDVGCRKPQAAETDIVKKEDIPGSPVSTFKMQSVKGPVHVKIYLGHKIAVVNEGTVPVVLKAGTLVMAFGKITYRKLGTNEAPNPDKEPIWKTGKTAS